MRDWHTRRSWNEVAKTPTEIVYAQGESRIVQSWGYEIEADQTPLRWFKVCLEDKRFLPQYFLESDQLAAARRILVENHLSAVEAAADYLSELWKVTLVGVERELGLSFVDTLPFRITVTVPATWSVGAMSRLMQAVRQAGIMDDRFCGPTTLKLIPEPEAAALAVLTNVRGRPNISSDDVITVCDCGGGTVVGHLIPWRRKSAKLIQRT